MRVSKKIFKKLRKRLRGIFYVDGKVAAAGALALTLLLAWGGNMAYQQLTTPHIDPTVYTPLLNTIAKGESNGNYNAYWGNAGNTSIKFTDMSVGQVLAWQEAYVKQGSASSAVGKYQIVRTTLAGLVRKLNIDADAKFDEKMQDHMAVALLEKRGAVAYMQDKLSREQFAANLAREWAALPKVIGENPEQSYYAGDGLNKVQISTSEIFSALATIKR